LSKSRLTRPKSDNTQRNAKTLHDVGNWLSRHKYMTKMFT
jgi:hypothetical protein